MRRYFICLLTFLAIGYSLALHPAAATNPATETVASDDTNWLGIGITSGIYASNGGLVSSVGTSWRIRILEWFETQIFMGTNNGTEVWAGNRFLYATHIKPLSKFYVGWGMNYPISQIETDTEEHTLSNTWFEVFMGYEYFFPSLPDLGYSFEIGINPLDDLGVRLLFGYHFYF
ncbi:MAG: hypothetical protein OXU23_27030 [Candidatus Poribacteria bacterium]|nr:hypothetical protein [Candidatus Poribacteria bacterium]